MKCNGLYLLHHINGQMHLYMIALSIKIINKCIEHCHVPIQVSQDGFVLRLICLFLGLWFANAAAAKIFIKHQWCSQTRAY